MDSIGGYCPLCITKKRVQHPEIEYTQHDMRAGYCSECGRRAFVWRLEEQIKQEVS